MKDLLEQEQKNLIIKKACKEGLIEFACLVDEKYDPQWFHKAIARKLEEAYERVLKGESPRIMIFMPPRHGKLCSDGTDVLTDFGWKKHGELKVGDFVFHPSGKKVKVIAVSDKDVASVEVEFTNGQKVVVHPNHEWTVLDRSNNKIVTLETRKIAEQSYYSGSRCRFQLPSINALEGIDMNLPLSPYFFGAWLGDGTSTAPNITSEYNDVALITNCDYDVQGVWEHKITGVPTYSFSHQGIIQKIKKLGCYNNKHIPSIYKNSSVEQRLQLLAGLIDTDGSKDKNSRYRIVTVSEQLANDIAELITGLGMRPYIMVAKPILSTSGIQGRKKVYSVGFQSTMEIPVALDRKKVTRIVPQNRIGIKQIKIVPPEQGNCIQVDSQDGLYLIGKTLIPTHNSDLATQKYPAWVLGKSPKFPIIVSSYSQDLATKFGQDTRDIIDSKNYQYIFDSRLRSDTQPKANWMTEDGGGYLAVGVGGSITGKGFKIGIVDDPFKNREEADSPVVRESVWRWWASTFSTREEGNSAEIVILTRWHEDDLAGRLLKQQKEAEASGEEHFDKWEILQFKAVAEVDELPYRKAGEPLWAGKFSIDKLLSRKNSIGLYEWSALYQQEPVDVASQEIKKEWFRYRTLEEVHNLVTRKFATIDTALSKHAKSDSTGVTRNYVDIDNRWNIRSTRYRINSKGLIDLVFLLHDEGMEIIGIEEGAYKEAIQPFLEDEMRKRNKFPNIVTLKHGGVMKETRIRGLIPRYETGSIFHIVGECADLEEEAIKFPKGIHDDCIDSLAYQLQIAEQPFPSEGGDFNLYGTSFK